MKLSRLCLAVLSAVSLFFLAASSQATAANEEELKSLEAFTMLPVIRSVSVSPDGKKIAILRATTKNGDYIVEIRDPYDLQKKPVTLGADKMLVSGVTWLNNDKIGVQFRQILKDGAKKYWVSKFAIANADGTGNWLLPFRKNGNASFSLLDLLPNNKNEVLVVTDINNNWIPDVVRLNVKTGSSRTVFRGNTKINGDFIVDNKGRVRAASGWNFSENAIDLYARAEAEDDWQLVHRTSPKSRESYTFLGFSTEEPNEIYVNANMGEDKTGIYTYNIKTKKYSERLFGLESVDTDGAIFDRFGALKGFTYTTKHPKRYFVDADFQALFDSIQPLFKGKFISIVSRSEDDNVLVIRTMADKDPGTYYIITDKSELKKIGEKSPLLNESNLADVKYITYKARDGRKIKAYVTIPNAEGPYPAVVLPHGGPWVRDTIIYDEWAQLLAYHGYIVIQPNYRGSTGYGLEHWIAGDKNWGLKMQDDLDDAAMFLVDKGLATKDKLAMFGWSYGGYAAFAASMRENNIYQCTVAGAGVSDLNRINATLNESRFLSKLQRPTIAGVSPIEHVDKVNVPILVVHGDIDGRVPVKHSREFVKELVKHHKQHKYIELKEADHFSDTLFYDHKTEFYGELINWLDNTCGLK